MSSVSPKKRNRQKIKQKIECSTNPEADHQYFQICVNIKEAKKLSWTHSHAYNSYVVVILGKEKHRTTIKKNMEDPCYREYFIFEWYAPLKELRAGHLCVAVMEPRCCTLPRLMGEAKIDLGAVWDQPNHQVMHKWAQLQLPREMEAGTVGFLKLDISIVCRDEIPKGLCGSNEECAPVVQPLVNETQTANYLIAVFAAYSLPLGTRLQGERGYGKPPNSYVKVSFCGLSAKTAVQYRSTNPNYNEQISIVEIFPNSCPLIRLEVCSSDYTFNKTLASADLRLADVSYDGENGFVPTFGPSLLHMYGNNCQNAFCNSEEGPHYKGALLVSLKTIVPFEQQKLRDVNVEPVPPIQINNLWSYEDFCIYCPILEVSMLDRHVTGKVSGVAISMGEIVCNSIRDPDFTQLVNEIKTRILQHTGSLEVVKTGNDFGHLDFSAAFPVLQLGITLPDFRSRIYRNNLINYIISDLENIVNSVEQKLKLSSIDFSNVIEEFAKKFDDTGANILKFMDYAQSLSPKCTKPDADNFVSQTDLDQKQTTLQNEEMEKLYKQVNKKVRDGSLSNLKGRDSSDKTNIEIKKKVKCLVAEAKLIVNKLKSIVFKSSEGWPDIVIWLLHGSTKVAYYKIPPGEVLHAFTSEQSGKFCGRIQTVYVKPIKCHKHLNSLLTSCYCTSGKIELMMWMGTYKEKSCFVDYIPEGYKLKTKDYDMCLKSLTSPTMIECRMFIYECKIKMKTEISTPLTSFVRAHALNCVAETVSQPNVTSPVWNQMIKICMPALTPYVRLITFPPTILVEVYEKDISGKCEIVGRTELQPVVDEKKNIHGAPKLQWYTLHKGNEETGSILMSAQLLQIPETVVKSTLYESAEKIYDRSTKDTSTLPTKLKTIQQHYEELPHNLIPKSSKYKMDVYWWGLRDVEITKKPCAVLEIDDYTLKSEIICNKTKNSNFPNGRVSQVFEAPLDEVYCPALNIRLYDSNTFGRTLFLGTNVVKNPKKYVVNWIPKMLREDSLKSSSIISNTFIRVSDSLYIKKSEAGSLNKCNVNNNNKEDVPSKKQIKRAYSWRRLFCQNDLDEEEYFLLPLYKKEKQIEDKMVLKTKSDNQDWWLRFFASQKNYSEDRTVTECEKIKIYESELENQPEFSKFKDWCTTLKLYNGSKTGLPEEDEKLRCGYLKVGIAIYEWPPPPDTVAVSVHGVELDRGYFDDHPNNDPNNFLVRVYVIRGINLMPKDFVGKSDPYVVIKCGSKTSGDRNQFIPNNLNPVFGKMHEFRCSLPEDYLLSVSLFDHSSVAADELIGTTSIDLENRIYTKHRARVGLSSEYNTGGPAKWRDCVKPSAILEEICAFNHMPPPIYPDNNTVLVNGVEYREEDVTDKSFHSLTERKESLCLTILHKWYTLDKFGYHLVPEHVETRHLTNPDKPGVSQGKIQLWVDIFPLDTGLFIPQPVNITPRKLIDYELRVIVWSVQNIGLKKLVHKKGVDIYAKAWIGHCDEAQYTDIHYQSTHGEGCFNWRMIFNFSYLHAENKLVRKDKGPFTESEERTPPIFVIQIIDNDATNGDDCLASLMLDLNNLPLGSKSGKYCSVDLADITKKINLFSITTIRGWWPLKHMDKNTGTSTFAGLIDLELTLIPREKALLMPVGMGREPPFPLPEPRLEQCPQATTYSGGIEKAAEYLIVIVIVVFIIAGACYWQFPSLLLAIIT